MSRVRTLLPLLAAVVLAACADGDSSSPLGPSSPAAPEQPEAVTGAASAGAIVDQGESFFTVDFVDYFPCVDEVVHVTSYVPFEYQLVQTPSGNFVYHDRIDPAETTGMIVGLTSGRVWTRSKNVSPFVERSTGGDGGMVHFTFKGDWVSDNAPDLKINEIFHANWNAGGELTAEQYRFNCRMAKS